jgi:hypothetical protein
MCVCDGVVIWCGGIKVVDEEGSCEGSSITKW